MPEVHPTAILEGDVLLADDVRVGPHCVISGPVRIGPGCRLIGNVYVHGPVTMGAENLVYPFSCIGFAPQSVSYDDAVPGHGVVIGDRNRLREGVTIHRAMTDDGPTRIGDDNFFMATSHAGHDAQVGNECILANGAMLGGHTHLGDRVNIGGGTAVHQFVRIGRGAMLSGGVATSRDVPPWFMLTGISVCGSINLIGLRRNGVSREEIDDVRWVYRTLSREGLSLKSAVERLKERRDRPLVAEYVAFIETSDRGICTGRGQASRGVVNA
jgi:UDP-N-acetylglucosamine acyltransferase